MILARKCLDLSASLTARAPAKLIISGEHAVVYGQPALAMAIDRYTTTTTAWHDSADFSFKFIDLQYAKTHTLDALRSLHQQLRREYKSFLDGKTNIRDVLKRPFELLQYSVTNLLEYLNLQLPQGLAISVDSNIPIGCGMGSSAAAVISTVSALSNFLELDWQTADYLSFAQEIENLQHGKSSGLDLHLVTYGGCVYFQNGVRETRNIPNFPLFIVNTGQPEASTGECVAYVTQFFEKLPDLATVFGKVTAAIDDACAKNDFAAFQAGIRANHLLLSEIGVVPEKVANFIRAIEHAGGAAKICGAGSVRGETAGVVLVVAEPGIEAVVKQYGYNLETIQVDRHGTRII